jgi:hypothetical protein
MATPHRRPNNLGVDGMEHAREGRGVLEEDRAAQEIKITTTFTIQAR